MPTVGSVRRFPVVIRLATARRIARITLHEQRVGGEQRHHPFLGVGRHIPRGIRPRAKDRVLEAQIMRELVRDRVRTGRQRRAGTSDTRRYSAAMATPLLPIQLKP